MGNSAFNPKMEGIEVVVLPDTLKIGRQCARTDPHQLSDQIAGSAASGQKFDLVSGAALTRPEEDSAISAEYGIHVKVEFEVLILLVRNKQTSLAVGILP